MAEEVFAPHDPPVAQDSMTAEDYAQILADLKPRFIHHPRCKELIAGPARRSRLRSRADVLRRSAPPHHGARRVHEGRPRASVPPPSRHMVLGAVRATELVAARVRDRVRQLDGVPPALLRRPGREQLVHLRLRRVDALRAAAGRPADQGGDAEAARGAGRRSSSTRRSASCTPVGGVLCSLPPICTRPCPTRPIGRGSASTSAPSISTISSSTALHRTSMRPARARRCGDFVRASDLEPLPEDVIESYRVVASGAA